MHPENELARRIAEFAQTDGDHTTAIPALTLHRRLAPTEPLHCIYNLVLVIVAQGAKQMFLRGESIRYGPGQSLLTHNGQHDASDVKRTK